MLARFPRSSFGLCLLALFLLLATSSHAHHLPPGMEDVDEFEDGTAFIAGLRHPLLGLSHWLFALTIGALAGTRLRHGFRLGGGLLAGLGIGAVVGLQGVALPAAELGQLLALAVPIMLLIVGNRLQASTWLGWVAVAALWQGNEHGIAWPMNAAAIAYLLGVFATTSGLILAGAGAALLAKHSRPLRNPFATLPH